jgi:hypothetical protein
MLAAPAVSVPQRKQVQEYQQRSLSSYNNVRRSRKKEHAAADQLNPVIIAGSISKTNYPKTL